jgi:hypothetical protein
MHGDFKCACVQAQTKYNWKRGKIHRQNRPVIENKPGTKEAQIPRTFFGGPRTSCPLFFPLHTKTRRAKKKEERKKVNKSYKNLQQPASAKILQT